MNREEEIKLMVPTVLRKISTNSELIKHETSLSSLIYDGRLINLEKDIKLLRALLDEYKQL